MPNSINYSSHFLKKVRGLRKRHPSLPTDLRDLESTLFEDAQQGISLGGGLHKLRLAIKAKEKERVEAIG